MFIGAAKKFITNHPEIAQLGYKWRYFGFLKLIYFLFFPAQQT